jgi:hypothetical protein
MLERKFDLPKFGDVKIARVAGFDAAFACQREDWVLVTP